MDRLPPELLHNIFIQLDLQQRLLCLTVCRSWWRVLDKHSLFYSVEMKEHNLQFYRMMKLLQQFPDRAAQVVDLDVVIGTDSFFNRRELINTFPNARGIRVAPYVVSRLSKFVSHNLLTKPTRLKSTVESLSDYYHCDLLSQMLYSGLLGRLKVLDLNFHGAEDIPPILSQLKDLPVLKRLTLQSLKFNLNVLQEIHENIPSIQDFSIQYGKLGAGSLSSDIVPAISITKLDIHTIHFDTANTHSQFYQYLIKKYINLTDIEYRDDALSKHYTDQRQQIYLNGVLDFLKFIGPMKKEITLTCLPYNINPFEALDSVDARIEKVHFDNCYGDATFPYVSRSKQSNYIKTIDITCTIPNSIHLLKDMPVLTSLNISDNPVVNLPLSLASCLAGCPPSLKSITIKARNLIIEPFHTQLDSVERLHIDCDRLTSDLGNIISDRFPNLVELKLTGEVVENIHIALKSPCFQKAIFSKSDVYDDSNYTYGFAFKSPNKTETEYYISDEGTVRIKEKRRVEYDEVAHLPILSVETLTDSKLEGDVAMTVLYANNI